MTGKAGKKASSYDIASTVVGDDGEPHKVNFCMNCFHLRQEERKKPAVISKRWRITVGEKCSRGKLSACLGSKGFDNKMWECYAAQKVYAKSLLNEAARALQLEKSWPEESPYSEEQALLRESDSLHLPGTRIRRAMKAGG